MGSYRLILTGATDNSANGRSILKSKLASFLGTSDNTLTELFQSLPAVLEEGLDLQTATQLEKTFVAFGATIILEKEVSTSDISELSFEDTGNLFESQEHSQDQNNDDLQILDAVESELDSRNISLEFEPPSQTPSDSKPAAIIETVAQLNNVGRVEEKVAEIFNNLKETSIDDNSATAAKPEEIASDPADVPSDVNIITEGKQLPFAKFDSTATKPSCFNKSTQPALKLSGDRQKTFNPKIIAAGAGLIAIIIIAIILMPKNNSKNNSVVSDPAALVKLLKQQKSANTKSKSESKPLSSQASSVAVIPDSTWQTSIKTEALIANLELYSGNDQIIEVAFKTESPQKKQLTPEEIVAGLTAAPWIEKFMLNSSRLAEANAGIVSLASFNIALVGRAYIKDELEAARIPAILTLEGELNEEKTAISGTWTLKTSDISSPNIPITAGINRMDNHVYRIFLTGSYTLTKVQSDK